MDAYRPLTDTIFQIFYEPQYYRKLLKLLGAGGGI